MSECAVCGTRLFWPEKHAGLCIHCNPDRPVPDDAREPYEGFCCHPERCKGFGFCPRDPVCID